MLMNFLKVEKKTNYFGKFDWIFVGKFSGKFQCFSSIPFNISKIFLTFSHEEKENIARIKQVESSIKCQKSSSIDKYFNISMIFFYSRIHSIPFHLKIIAIFSGNK